MRQKPIYASLLMLLLLTPLANSSHLLSPNWTHIEFIKFSRESGTYIHFYLDFYKLIWSRQKRCTTFDQSDQCSELRNRESFFEIKKFLRKKMFRLESTVKYSKLSECPCSHDDKYGFFINFLNLLV